MVYFSCVYETFLHRSSNKSVTEDLGVGTAELKVKLSSHKGNYLPPWLCLWADVSLGALRQKSLEIFQPQGALGWSLQWTCEQIQAGTHWECLGALTETLFLLCCKRDSLYRFSLPPFPSDFRRNMMVLQAQRGCMWQGNWGCSLIFIQFLDGLSAVHWPNAN